MAHYFAFPIFFVLYIHIFVFVLSPHFQSIYLLLVPIKKITNFGLWQTFHCTIYQLLLFVLLLFVVAPMAFSTSSCSVDGGSESISVVVDRYRNLSETAVNE